MASCSRVNVAIYKNKMNVLIMKLSSLMRPYMIKIKEDKMEKKKG